MGIIPKSSSQFKFIDSITLDGIFQGSKILNGYDQIPFTQSKGILGSQTADYPDNGTFGGTTQFRIITDGTGDPEVSIYAEFLDGNGYQLITTGNVAGTFRTGAFGNYQGRHVNLRFVNSSINDKNIGGVEAEYSQDGGITWSPNYRTNPWTNMIVNGTPITLLSINEGGQIDSLQIFSEANGSSHHVIFEKNIDGAGFTTFAFGDTLVNSYKFQWQNSIEIRVKTDDGLFHASPDWQQSGTIELNSGVIFQWKVQSTTTMKTSNIPILSKISKITFDSKTGSVDDVLVYLEYSFDGIVWSGDLGFSTRLGEVTGASPALPIYSPDIQFSGGSNIVTPTDSDIIYFRVLGFLNKSGTYTIHDINYQLILLFIETGIVSRII